MRPTLTNLTRLSRRRRRRGNVFIKEYKNRDLYGLFELNLYYATCYASQPKIRILYNKQGSLPVPTFLVHACTQVHPLAKSARLMYLSVFDTRVSSTPSPLPSPLDTTFPRST